MSIVFWNPDSMSEGRGTVWMSQGASRRSTSEERKRTGVESTDKHPSVQINVLHHSRNRIYEIYKYICMRKCHSSRSVSKYLNPACSFVRCNNSKPAAESFRMPCYKSLDEFSYHWRLDPLGRFFLSKFLLQHRGQRNE